MQETTRLAGLIQERLDDVVSRHAAAAEALGDEILPLFTAARQGLSGGKRMRAQFAVLGYQAVQPLDLFADPEHELAAVLDAACALELFHTAALLHDDVIDRSDIRRGHATTHRQFETIHQQHRWRGSGTHFGISAAILLGDLLQTWADELFEQACERLHETSSARDFATYHACRAAREHFNQMRSEVALGQYLDVVEEQRIDFADHREQLERSTRVLVYKSAKYSVEAPLLIGGAFAGANEHQLQELSEFGLPVGVAFQLHDDLLGAFGDTERTGKPAGDDLVWGKRTVLITLARNELPTTQRRLFDELLSEGTLTPEQLAMLQQTIQASGAVTQVTQMISRNIERAEAALNLSSFAPQAREKLVALAHLSTTSQGLF